MCFFLAASAPTRTLGRRKLVRNRFTIDTDIVFDGDTEHQELALPKELDSKRLQQKDEQEQSELAGDTDRWVEEQFDLEEYEDQEDVKETDILSDDDDEFCQTPISPSDECDLESPMMALALESQNVSEDDVKTSDLKKGSSEDQNRAKNDEIWVRRKLSGSSPDCAT